MPLYRYVGRTRKGEIKRGTIESNSEKQALLELREKDIILRELKEVNSRIFLKKLLPRRKKVKIEHFVIYCRQFATLIRAGISVLDATRILIQQTESKQLKQTLKEVEADIITGKSYSEAVERQPDVFPSLFVHMVRAGEATGEFDNTLDQLANYYEKQNRLLKKVQSAMAYPTLLFFVILVVALLLLVTVIPSLSSSLTNMGIELPKITVIVMTISEWILQYWCIGFILIALCIGVFLYLYKNEKKFAYYFHVMLLKMPIFGKVLQKTAIARMTQTLASLFAGSIPVLQSLSIVEKVVGNPVMGEVLNEARKSLEQGKPLSEPLKKSWVFPPFVSHMTAIGEQTGQLDEMLGKIAEFYEEDVDRTIDTLKSLIEPILILFLAVVVGIIVISILIPMFSMYTEL